MTGEEIKLLREYYSLDHSVSDQEIEQTLNKSLGLTVIRIHRAKVKLAEAVKNSILKGVNMERKIEVKIVGKTNVKKMKPCPFCGKSNFLTIEKHGVYCGHCHTTGPDGNSKASSAEFWNKRADQTQ